uniref:FAD:protein FMN transferase n=1 Tax=Solibacter usitatus (strain Ellin6076) TaxID=234267 RepID=Q01TE4_SOLUE
MRLSFLVFCLPLLLHARDPVRVEVEDEAMGTTFALTLYGVDRTALNAAAASAFIELHRLDGMLSNYRPESEWSAVNRSAALRPVRVSPELFHLLTECLRYGRESDGAFDITVGPLMKIWGFYKGEGLLPRKTEITTALRLVGYAHVQLDAASQSVSFDQSGVELDPGGIGKGYAVDNMVAVLKAHGVGTALVSAGGSSIYGLGAPPETPAGWKVRIRAPDDPRRTAAEVVLKDMSLSTSGGYEKFFLAEGRTYSHIMNPRTGYPAQGTSSVSVVAPRTIDGEVWAKPYFVLGRAWTAAHRPKDFKIFLCDDTSRHTCAWIP